VEFPIKPQRTKAAQILILCCAVWSFSFPSMKALTLLGERDAPGHSSVFFASLCVTLRFAIAGLVLAAVLGRKVAAVTRSEFKQGLGLGVFGAIGLLLQMDGMAYTHASTAAFLTQGYCVWIPIWFALRHRHLPGWSALFATLLVVAGAGVLAGVDLRDFRLGRGEAETLLGSVFFAGQILWLERREFTGNHVARFSLVMFAVMALTMLPLTLALAQSPGALFRAYSSPTALGLLALLVGPCTLVTFLLANRWQPEVSATEAGLLYCTEPVFTSAVTLFFPGLIAGWAGIAYANEQLTWNLLIGGGLILAANVWMLLRPAR
jgi:drug/metabolite transporter (DMT)-like permease